MLDVKQPSSRVSRTSISALLQALARPGICDAASWTPPGPGSSIGRFELVRELGRGGFGVVYEARDPLLNRSVALKLLAPRRDSGATALHREAEAIGALAHPNLVQLFDAGASDAGGYLIFELLRGETLASRIARGGISVAEALRIGEQIARGLAHAHAQGVVHRDLKPSNVVVTDDGDVKLLDFGLAHALGLGRRIHGGTPEWMSPEQRRGAPEDERTDIWALGAILRHIVTGRHSGERQDPASEVAPPPALEALIARMLKEDPVSRPRGAAEVADALRAIAAGVRLPAPVPFRRRWGASAIAAVSLAVAAAAGALLLPLAAPGPDPGEPITVAVADFSNETGDRELATASGLLMTALEQGDGLRVLTRTRMVDVARQRGHREVTRIDDVIAREIAAAAGVRTLFTGAVRRLGSRYIVEIRATDDESTFGMNGWADSKDAIPQLIEELARRACDRLGRTCGKPDTGPQRGAALTADLTAYAHYFGALEAYGRWRWDEARSGFDRAVAIDPAFAAAWLRLGFIATYDESGAEDADRAMAEVERRQDRLPQKERRLFEGWKAYLARDHQRATRLLNDAVQRYPDDKEVHYLAGEATFHAWDDSVPGSYRDYAEPAARHFGAALDLDPGHLAALLHLVDILAELQRPQEGLDRARRAAAAHPDATAFALLAGAEAYAGDLDAAYSTAQLAAARAAGPREYAGALDVLSRVLVARGDLAQAVAVLERAALNGSERLRTVRRLAIIDAAQGQRRRALARLDAEKKISGGDRLFASYYFGTRAWVEIAGGRVDEGLNILWRDIRSEASSFVFARNGQLKRARELAASAAAGTSERRMLDAQVDWWKGRHQPAMDALRAINAGRVWPAREREMLATWLLQSGQAAQALPLFRSLRHFERYRFLSECLRPRSYLGAAAALEALGRREEASAELDRFLEEWRGADPDLPYLLEARRTRARFGARD